MSEDQSQSPVKEQEELRSPHENAVLINSPSNFGSMKNLANIAAFNKKKTLIINGVEIKSSDLLQGSFNKNWIERLLNNTYVVIFMTIITCWALIGDDIRVLTTDKDGDNGFYGAALFCFCLFFIEIILASIGSTGYFLSFFFVLDIISTLTLLFDIGWFLDLITGDDTSNSAIQMAKAGQASQVAARAARVVRIVRLIRLIRIVKLYKHAQQVLQVEMKEMDEEARHFEGADRPSKDNHSGEIDENGMPRKEPSGALGSPVKPTQTLLPAHTIMAKNSDDQLNVKIPSSKPRNSQRIHSAGLRGARTLRHSQMVDFFSFNQRQSELDKNKLRTSDLEGGQSNLKGDSALLKNALQNDLNHLEVPKESNVSKKLSDLTIRRVIILVLTIMISIPLFSPDTYTSPDSSFDSGLQIIYLFKNECGGSNQSAASQNFNLSYYNYINQLKNIRTPLMYLDIGIPAWQYTNGDYTALRNSDQGISTIGSDADNTKAVAIYSTEADSFMDGWLGILRTLFVCTVLTVGAILFTQDSNDLVLVPIEEMLVKVKRIAVNPIEAAQIEEREAFAFEQLQQRKKSTELKEVTKVLDEKKKRTNYETDILERLITKIGALLALGFGEAGSEIIAKNMAARGEVDPMIPGRKVIAIFGFCDIRNFTDATEVLQEGVMVFVNEIAEIVHSTVDHFSGSANKNIGDAFLLVWKFPEQLVEQEPEKKGEIRLKRLRQCSQLADLSLIGILKTIDRISTSSKLEKYRHNKGLNHRLPNYTVKMGFGLHIGWGIEGAIGSEFKIDASYLSPNVNMASRLEGMTKGYRVQLLISGPLRDTMTDETQKELRHIDKILVKGHPEPIDLYTCDVDLSRLTVNNKTADYSTMNKNDKKKHKVTTRIRRNELNQKIMSNSVRVSSYFRTDKEIMLMRSTFQGSFKEDFERGLQQFLEGNWEAAKAIFEKTMVSINNYKDGPSECLLEVINEAGGKAPGDWKGYRLLNDK